MWKLVVTIAAIGCRPKPDADPDPIEDPIDDPITPGSVDPDADADGFPAGVDCDDTDPEVYPGAPDVCGDDRVTDCERTSDDGLVTVDGRDTFTSLADALEAAPANAEVRVCPGDYLGGFAARRAVRLVAHAGPEVTVLHGADPVAVLQVPGGSSVSGFSLVDGKNHGSGGGVSMISVGTLTITDCDIHDNHATNGGGIAVFPGAVAILSGVTVRANRSDESGGGVHGEAGATIDLSGSVVSENVAGAGGGGVFLQSGSITGGEITANVASGVGYGIGGGGLSVAGTASVTGTDIGANEAIEGGGLFAIGDDELPITVTLTGVALHDNSAETGGGLRLQYTDTVSDASTEVRGNTAIDGGGAAIRNGDWTGGRFSENQATHDGGGVQIDVGDLRSTTVTDNVADEGGGVAIDDFVSFEDVVVAGNSADRGGGVARNHVIVSITYPTWSTFVGGSLTGNSASSGGGFYGHQINVDLRSVIVSDNTAERGGGVFLEDRSSVALVDSKMLRNAATVEGGGAELRSSSLVSTTSDWGDGPDDNLPGDVHIGEQEQGGYAASATFECTERHGCTPLP